MPLWDDIKQYARRLKVYALGKGILSLAVWGAAALGAATGIGVMLPAAVIAIGGTALTAVNRLYQQSLYEQDMVAVYRNDIAEHLHIAPEDVTRAHLREAATDNPIIAQALARQRKKTILTISTAALAGLVSVVLLGAFDAENLLRGLADQSLTAKLKPLASFISIGTVAAASSLVLHGGLDLAIGYGTGISKVSAHDLISTIDHHIAHGKPICREQVYEVLVAADPARQQSILQRYHKPYAALTHAEQSNLLHQSGIAEPMDRLATHINSRQLAPSSLAFRDTLERALATPTTTQPKAASMPAANFVKRLGLAPTENHTHTERVTAARQQPSQPSLA